MLYNQSTGKPLSVAKVMSTECLVTWLEKQPPEKAYKYANVYEPCLHAQYFAAMGMPVQALSAMSVSFPDQKKVFHMPQSFVSAAMPMPHTFGAALKRAKAHLK